MQFGEIFEIKIITADNGDFGDLKGMQFDSDRCGGYLYFWSSGTIDFHLVDYELGDEIVPITIRMDQNDVDAEATVSELIGTIVNVLGSKVR
jgi:hypothetical protein